MSWRFNFSRRRINVCLHLFTNVKFILPFKFTQWTEVEAKVYKATRVLFRSRHFSTWFQLFLTDKIPWLLVFVPSVFILANNTQVHLSFPVFCVIFLDFSSLFKTPWFFPDWKIPFHFSSPSGNPVILCPSA